MNFIDGLPAVKQSYGIPAIALLLALLFGWSAEELGGVAAITGAFIAGVGFSRAKDDVKHEIEQAVSYIAYAFLVPIFFINVGLETDLSTFPLSALPFAGLLLVVALVSKLGGCGLGAKLGGFDNQQSLQLGVCMISRGEVGLIIASLGLSVGVFRADQPLFAVTVSRDCAHDGSDADTRAPSISERGASIMKLVLLITTQIDKGLDVAQAWQEAGAPGVTIIRSHGLHTLQKELQSGSVELPRMVVSMGAAMAAIIDNMEERGEVIISIVEDELWRSGHCGGERSAWRSDDAERGLLVTLPIERAVGIQHHDLS